MSTTPDPDALLRHAPWMRRLAHSLVRDAERAEELAQETWLRVLQHPPRGERPLQGWIATVMRNLWRSEVRGRVRREARERAGGPAAPPPSPLDLLERAALQRELVDAVLGLEEPYRRTILLRYLEERSPSAIARLDEVPLATVKTRLARGLARLRERLKHTDGPPGSGTVLACLMALEGTRGPLSSMPWILGALTMKAKLVAALVLLAAAIALWPDSSDPARPAEARAAVVQAPEPPGASSASPGPSAPVARRPPAPSARTPASRAPAERTPSAAPGLGHVVDDQGRAVGDVQVLQRNGERSVRLARSDASGNFTLEGASAIGRLSVDDPRWATVLASLAVDARRLEASAGEVVIVVAPAIALAGVVVEESGAPVAGAGLALVHPDDLRARVARVLDHAVEVPHTASTDEHGRFELPVVPALEGARLEVLLEGRTRLSVPCPLTSRTDLVLVLKSDGSTHDLLTGVVVDALDQPVPGAHVSWGLDSRSTDAEGRFAFPRADPRSLNRTLARYVTADEGLLWAVHPGHLPGQLRAEVAADGTPRWPQPLVLRLGGPPLTLVGRVVGPDEEPLAGAQVWVADPTFFGALSDPGAAHGGGPELTHVESLLAGQPAGWNPVATDEQGRFEIPGLLDREYTVEVMDPGSLLRSVHEHVRAGPRQVRLKLDGALFPVLSGMVVDARGAPVPGLSVAAMCDAFRTRVGDQVVGTHHGGAPGVLTDAAGRFRLERVPRDLVYLRIDGADAIPLEWGRHVEGGLQTLAGGRPDELVLQVALRCHFRVELALPDEADEVGVLDARGEPLTLSEFRGTGRRDGPRLPLIEGRSSALAVSDAAAQLVLYRAGAEVRRLPLHLAPGESAVLRP